MLLIGALCGSACSPEASQSPGRDTQDQQEQSQNSDPNSTGYSGFEFTLAEANTPLANPEQAVVFDLSTDPRPELREKLRVAFALTPAIEANTLEPFWNPETHEGLLRLVFSSREAYGSVPYASRNTHYLSTQNYLYTDFNQQGLNSPYDTHQGLIHLKVGTANLTVGRYRNHIVGHEYQTWTHPSLCEGDFAAICILSIELSYNSEKRFTTFPYRGTFYITLKAGVMTEESIKIPLAIIPELDVVKSNDPFSVAQPKY